MIRYSSTEIISVPQFIDVLERSGLGARRPIADGACMTAMVEKAALFVTAWDGDLLVGVGRCLTDFVYNCYLADLAVDQAYQQQGIGKRLIEEIKSTQGPLCKVILLAAPAAVDYYPKIGFTQHPSAWVLEP